MATSAFFHLKPICALSTNPKQTLPFTLKPHQTRHFHHLPSGLKMEVIVHKPIKKTHKRREELDGSVSPLVFVHGSYHAAWCWAEHWLGFFAEKGFECYAVSLLGQGESDSTSSKVAGTLQTHVNDLAHFIQKELPLPPVLVGHSFGGLIVQNYIANMRSEQ
ncbi:hypothetical protein AKJ16_DCAP26732, partial [Drosera capensis]